MKIARKAASRNIIRAAVDLAVITLSWIAAFELRFSWEIVALSKGGDTLARYLTLVPFLWLSYLAAFVSLGVYAVTLERKRIWDENFQLARAHAFGFLLFVALAFFFFEHRYSRVTMLIFFALTPFLLPLGRSLVRKISRSLERRRPAPKLRALLMGEGPVCDRLSEIIAARPDWHLDVIQKLQPDDRESLKVMLAQQHFDVAFVATHQKNSHWVEEVFGHIGNTVAEIIYVPDFGAPTFLSPRFLRLGDLNAIVLNSSALTGYGPYLKRVFDVIFAGTFIVVFSPVYVLCALAVRLSSPGPILYRQVRMGLDGRTFVCLKFRGMRVDAEKETGPVWAKKDDDRTTAVGRWLRRTSLDEIPQFFNVLRGDMSVVGPRPERPVFVDSFRSRIPGYMLRHTAKAGITGWAQINGWRGDTSIERRIECDLWYLQNWSLALDIKICLLTPFKGLIHPNAY
jgi:Undecaprenyl-phosphate glucose phosphotransferase